MLNHKRLLAMARKWRQMTRNVGAITSNRGHTSSVTCKGHIALYSMDQKRFTVPISYLSTNTFRELFKLAEDLFGLPSDGPITLPCDSDMMEYIISSLRQRASKDMERELLKTIATSCHSNACLTEQGIFQHQVLCSF